MNEFETRLKQHQESKDVEALANVLVDMLKTQLPNTTVYRKGKWFYINHGRVFGTGTKYSSFRVAKDDGWVCMTQSKRRMFCLLTSSYTIVLQNVRRKLELIKTGMTVFGI